MLSAKMNEQLNTHLNLEIFSSHLYLSMSAYFEKMGLGGFASWMYHQYEEETGHMQKFFKYVGDREGDVTISAMDAPQTTWESPLDAFEDSLKHEKEISAKINQLVDLALEERDHATNNFLQWFVSEQVEEESTVGQIVSKLQLIGDSKDGLYHLDKELNARTSTTTA